MRKYLISCTMLILVSCGVNDSSEQTDGISDSDHRVFVSSQSFTGNFGGIEAADSICKQMAVSAGLARNYKAILSTAFENAESKLNITGSVFMFTSDTVRVLIAASGIDLWGTRINNLNNSINRDQNYNLVTDSVWSGTDDEGFHLVGNSCANWQAATGNGFSGSTNRVSAEWIENIPSDCATLKRLYCISVI